MPYTKTKLSTTSETITCLYNFFLCPIIFFPCYVIHHIFVKRRTLRQQNQKRGQRETYRLFKLQELLIWSKSTLNLFYIFAKVARLWIPHPSHYLQERLCVEVSTAEGQTATTKSLLLLLASSDRHMKDFVHMKDRYITLFS